MHSLTWLDKKLTFNALLFIVSVFFAQAAFSGGVSALPRQFGPFELGMSPAKFQKITGINPSPCPICIEKELFVTLDKTAAGRFVKTTGIGDGIDFFFYNNALYHISISPRAKDVFATKQEFGNIFGGLGQDFDKGNGVMETKWEDSETVLSINYRPVENEVFSVNYYDWNAKEERDWRESVLFESTASMTP